jgi:DNA-binding XRE family transcriptional regulator
MRARRRREDARRRARTAPYWNVISGPTLPECQGRVYCDVIVPGCLGRKAGSMSASPAFQAALGLAVKARREELKLTQEQLDNNTELHQRWISNVETGKRNPSYGSLRRLAAGLDLTASELLARAEQIEASGIQALNAPAVAQR